MAGLRSFTILIIFGTLIASTIDAKKSVILDEAGSASDIELVAQSVCDTTKGSGLQIAHVSTVSRLASYLQDASKSADHKHFACSQKYLESVEQLNELVTKANDNVCGEEKLKLIEAFHLKYVSKIRKHVKQQKRSNKAPKIAKLFFMQYATEISTICERNAVDSLTSIKQVVSEDHKAQINKLKTFTDTLGMADLSKGYKGVYLMWNMVDSLPLDESEKISRYLVQDGPNRLNIQVQDPVKLITLQKTCEHMLKPVYGQTILPVLRLTDLGYYPRGHQLASSLQDEESSTRSLFFATQICESILPLRIFGDHQLKPDQIVVVNKNEVAQLPVVENAAEIGEISKESKPVNVKQPSVTSLDRLSSIQAAEVREEVEKIQANVASRSKVINKMLRIVVKNTKNKLKTSLGKFLFLSKKKEHEPMMDSQALATIDEETLLQIEETDENSIVRNKRMTVKEWLYEVAFFYVVWIVCFIVLSLYTFVWGIWCIVTFLLGFSEKHFGKILDAWRVVLLRD